MSNTKTCRGRCFLRKEGGEWVCMYCKEVTHQEERINTIVRKCNDCIHIKITDHELKCNLDESLIVNVKIGCSNHFSAKEKKDMSLSIKNLPKKCNK